MLARNGFRMVSASAMQRTFPLCVSRLMSSVKEDTPQTESPTPATQPELANVLAEKDKIIAGLQDSYRRALADTENIRQRSRKEVEQAKTFAISKFGKDLLDSADILQMAIDSVPPASLGADGDKALKDLHTGVSMTRTELLKTFKRHGMKEFDPLGEPFNHDLHQALFRAPMAGKEPGTIFDVQKKGYTLNGRVIRPAQVGVVQGSDD